MKTVLMGLMMLAAGCAESPIGPSKDRLQVLLHECRESNREHLRLLKEYDARPMFDMSKCTALKGPSAMPGNGGWLCPTDAEAMRPEQAHGLVEMNVGGY